MRPLRRAPCSALQPCTFHRTSCIHLRCTVTPRAVTLSARRNKIDNDVEVDMDVLDDVAGEAEEVCACWC